MLNAFFYRFPTMGGSATSTRGGESYSIRESVRSNSRTQNEVGEDLIAEGAMVLCGIARLPRRI